jgi:hypothetical protein
MRALMGNARRRSRPHLGSPMAGMSALAAFLVELACLDHWIAPIGSRM